MAFRFMLRRHLLCRALVGCAAAMAAVSAAAAPFTMTARYAISMSRVQVGELVWAVHFSSESYVASANGNASGVFSVLVRGEGSITTRGAVVGGKPMPARVSTTVIDDDGRDEVQVAIEGGEIKRVNDHSPPPKANRIQVTPNLLHGVSDPLSAMLIPADAGAFAQSNCDRTLRIFDGRRRYNLALSFKRIDTLKIERGYSGRVLVCGVVLRPIAGYDPDSLLVRYLAGKLDLELWFAPVAGGGIIVPVRSVMPTLIGTMELRAVAFETAAEPETPAPQP